MREEDGVIEAYQRSNRRPAQNGELAVLSLMPLGFGEKKVVSADGFSGHRKIPCGPSALLPTPRRNMNVLLVKIESALAALKAAKFDSYSPQDHGFSMQNQASPLDIPMNVLENHT
jgi:hypothetical protein